MKSPNVTYREKSKAVGEFIKVSRSSMVCMLKHKFLGEADELPILMMIQGQQSLAVVAHITAEVLKTDQEMV